MSRPLKFKKNDYAFISDKFPNYFRLLKAKAHDENDEVWVETKDQSDYDHLLDELCLELGDALNNEGNLSSDGLRLESAWDYADREGVPFGQK